MALEDIDKALREIEGMARPSSAKKRSKKSPDGSLFEGFFRKILLGVFLLVVPFAVLLRGSTYAYQEMAWGSWASLLIGLLAAILVVALYLLLLGKKVGIKKSIFKYSLMASGLLVGVFVIYSMLFVSASNLKSTNLKNTYTELHPLLRISVSTMILVDKESIITDIGRRPADYDKMGLPRLENSLHFAQSNGFVHAIDFRTNGRGALRNKLVEWYFKILGFRTLRHVGTADHLHISLPPNS